MLMTGRDITLPEIEPRTRSMFYPSEESGEMVEILREEGMWKEAVAAAEKAYDKKMKILNVAGLDNPQSLLLGTLWPLLAGSTVFLADAGPQSIPDDMKNEVYDTLIMDSKTLDFADNFLHQLKTSKIVWCGSGIEDAIDSIGDLCRIKPVPIRETVGAAGFIP